MLNRGRIQAQGENLEQSEAWAKPVPLTESEGLALLENLYPTIIIKKQKPCKNIYSLIF